MVNLLAFTISSVNSAQVQIVQGEKYLLRIDLEKPSPDADRPKIQKRMALATVWAREWLDEAEVVNFVTRLGQNSPDGGWHRINFEDIENATKNLIINSINAKISQQSNYPELEGYSFLKVLGGQD